MCWEEINIKKTEKCLACREEKFPVINHNNINPKRHLNQSKLHFNNYDNSIFVKNINFLSNLIWSNFNYSTTNFIYISESFNIFENELNKIKMQRLENVNILIAGHLNINSIRNKFEMVVQLSLICNLK